MADVDQVSSQPDVLHGASWEVGQMPSPATPCRQFYDGVKRLLDLGLSLAALLVLWPLFLVIGLAIKLDSSGPVFFTQERVGYDPQRCAQTVFKMYKFRSMRYHADESLHYAYVSNLIRQNTAPQGSRSLKMANDTRITRVGRLLRKTSLDELPQLINVVRSEMSLVGPRPALPYEVALYEDWHKYRLQALPGMTGWWQVMGRNRVSFEDMVRLDIYYVENRSLVLDLKTLALTPLAVIKGNGAG